MKPSKKDSEYDPIREANENMLDSILDKTSRLVHSTRKINNQLVQDGQYLEDMRGQMTRGELAVNRSKDLVKSIVDDPTSLGVCKISTATFTVLCILWFGGKLIYHLIK